MTGGSHAVAARRLGLIALAWLVVAPGVQALRPAQLVQGFPRGQLVLATTHDRCLLLQAWFADRPEHQAQGLMFVEHLEELEGMLFRYRQPAVLTMWMRNTYVPLDMLFIAPDGAVVRVETGTTPMSERRISSGEAVAGVLEVNAGVSERWGLGTGARLLLAE